MSSKASIFHNFVCKTQHSIYIITETSFHREILSSEFFPSQYVVYRCDRSIKSSYKKSGGGVLIAVDASISSELIVLPNSTIEHLCVKLAINRRSMYIYVTYIPPGSPISSYTACCDTIVEINNAAKSSDIILLTGDFNLPLINWTYDEEMDVILPLNVCSDTECLFVDTVLDLNLIQISNLYNKLNKILDLIFTNDPSLFRLHESKSPFVVNDIHHKSIEIILRIEGPNDKHLNQQLYYNFKKTDKANFHLYLENIDWINELNNGNINVNVDKFYNFLFDAINLFVPTTMSKPNKYPQWYDARLINLQNREDKAYREMLKYNSETMNLQYVTCIKDKIKYDPKHF